MGLLPFSPCSSIEPPESDCSWLPETGAEILATALSGLLDFLPPAGGACQDTFDTYLTMGEPVAEMYDALSVNLVRYGATQSAQALRARGGECPPAIFPQQVAVWQVTLWENCVPTPTTVDGRLIVPAPERLDAVAQWLYAHGIAIYNAVVAASVTGSWSMPDQITRVDVGDLTPRGPQGAAAGWSFQVSTLVGDGG